MKNATKHADVLKSVVKKLKKEHEVPERGEMSPLMALVRGAMIYDVLDSRAEEAMKAIDKEFVDLNELRVATELEVQALLGAKYPEIVKRVNQITTILNGIFEKESTLSLDRIKTISKRDARQFLKELPGMTSFVEAYIMTFGLEGGAVPVDGQMVGWLKEQGAVDEEAQVEEVQKFLENQVKSEECYECYVLIRKGAEGGGKKKKS